MLTGDACYMETSRSYVLLCEEYKGAIEGESRRRFGGGYTPRVIIFPLIGARESIACSELLPLFEKTEMHVLEGAPGRPGSK